MTRAQLSETAKANIRIVKELPNIIKVLTDLVSCYEKDLKTIEDQRVAVKARTILDRIAGLDNAR